MIKLGLFILGSCCFLTGLLWVGQGLDYIHWPASSFMIREPKWAYSGLVLSFLGLIFLWLAKGKAKSKKDQ
jgi:hypothetical protein